MKRKPWPLIVLALLHLFAPLGNIVANSIFANVTIGTYINALFHPDELIRTIIFLCIPVLGGILIYICKKWSYYLYLILMIFPFTYSYMSWQSQPTIELGIYLIAFYLINLLAVGYFILPQVRQVYFDPRLRWWETKPRFKADFETTFTWVDQKGSGEIKNLSEGGLFIETDLKMNTKGRIDIDFKYKDQNYALKGEVVYSKNSNGRLGYGISLLTNDTDRETVKRLILVMSEQGLLITGRAPTQEDTFTYWVKRLLTQRKGWVPETDSKSR
tara:strand:- start:1887 stop:2702 length:816 start_codon:yes stop_codon:yes gene_type:complete